MKTGKILPFFIILLGSLALIDTLQPIKNQPKLIGINFQGLSQETAQFPWNLISLKEGNQWKDLQPQEKEFEWKLMDKAFKDARSQKIPLKWEISLKHTEYPKWFSQLTQEQQVATKNDHLSNLLQAVCKRYQKIDYISLEIENWRETTKISEQIKRFCPNTQLLISYQKQALLSGEINEGLQILRYLKSSDLIKGIDFKLTSVQKLSSDLSGVERIFQDLDLLGIEIYVSELPILEDKEQKTFQEVFDSLYKNIHIKGITLKIQNLTKASKSNNQGELRDVLSWVNSNYLSKVLKESKEVFMDQRENKIDDEFGTMIISHDNIRLLAIKASFTRSINKWTLKCDATGSTSTLPIVSYLWAWGDKTTDLITNGSVLAQHTYATAGTYSASLTITDNAGNKDPVSYSVKINGNVLPTASFTTVITAYSVAGTSTSTDSDGVIAAYAWGWGDNTTIDTIANPSHNYALAGTYTISLAVTDENGGVSTPKTASVTVPPTAALPVAKFVTTVNKLSVSFNASTSTDDFGTIASYFWTYNDGTTETTTVPTVTHVYPSAKNYNPSLQVTNNRTAKSGSVTKTITTISNVIPVAVINTPIIQGYVVTVSSASTDSDGTVTGWRWGWGDTTANSSTSTATHTYAAAGSYTITLIVVDNDGGLSASKNVQVTVPSAGLTAGFVAYVNKLAVTFDASSSLNPYGTIVSYAWNYDDTIKETTSTPITSHTYASVKSWNVNLQVTDDKGAKNSITIAVATTTNSIPVANFATPTPNGYTVNLASTSTDSDGTIASYKWNSGDTASNYTTSSVTHTYAQAGTYTVTLSVVDNLGSTSLPKTAQVTVPSALPVASFTATVNQLTVAFDASGSTNSFGTINSYRWDFGDTTTKTTTVPTVTCVYNAVGSYTVSLQVSDNKNAKGSTSKTVVTVANAAPIANFVTPTPNGYTVNVVSTSTDSDGTVASYKWSWGDNTANSTTSSGTHIYTQAGTYIISLTVVDNDGSASTVKTQSVTVPSTLPVASFSTAVSKMTVSFDASSSTNAFGTTTSYVWTFGDSSTVTTTIPTTSHTYTTVGTFTVSLKIIDNKNAQASTSKTITTIANVSPTSNFNVVTLTAYTASVASTSTDTDGTIATYKWNWGDSTANDSTSAPSHTYAQAGTYTISLTVVDNDGSASTVKTQSVTVPTVLPVAAFTTTLNKMSVSFDASGSTDSFGTIASYVWNFGDTFTTTTTVPTTSHTYTTVGTFTVSLQILDNKNAQATTSKTVTIVANVAPTANFNIVSRSGYVIIVTSTSSDSDGTIAVYQWNWGDGTSNDTTSSPSHTYNQKATYTITLTVKDNNGDWSPAQTLSVTVPDSLPTASFTALTNQFSVNVDATASAGMQGVITTYTWNWGDGSTSTNTIPTASHTYLTPDMYVITLQVTDSKGVSSNLAEKSIIARFGSGLYPSWKWENFFLQKTLNQCKYFISTSRWLNNDGSIKYLHYFSKRQ